MADPVIVLGVDGSDAGMAAVRFVAGLAAREGARVVAVHVFEPLRAMERATPPVDFSALRGQAEAALASTWTGPLAEAGVPTTCRVVEGLAVEALVAAAAEEGAEMVVIGSHGHAGWRDRVFGSVALSLPAVSPVPVVLVPSR